MKKLIALILLGAMALALVGCPEGGPGQPPVPPTPPGDGFIDNLGDRDYQDEDFVVATGDLFDYEVYANEESTDVLEEAVYKRNRRIEERFNINIVPDITLNNNECGPLLEYIQNSYNSGDSNFDIAMVYVYRAGTLVTDAMLYDLRSEWVPYVSDALKNGSEWWSPDINNAFSVQGHQYVGVSDYCITAMAMTYAMAFNKQIEEDNNIASNLGHPDMYDIVKQKKWTIDLMRTIVKDMGEDLTDDQELKVEDDFFGFLCNQTTALDQFAPAFNINYVINDGEMSPEIFTLDSRVVSGFTALYDLFYGPGDGTLTIGLGGTYNNEYVSAFTEGRAFMIALPLMRFSEDLMHNMDDEYGLLPYPKLTVEQKQYYSGTVDNYSVICVPAVHAETRLEMIGTMVEALSAETHNSVEQPYYDLIVTHKNTRDEQSIEMIQIIMDGRLYDFATLNYYRLNYDNPTNSNSESLGLFMRLTITNKTSDVSSLWEAVKDQLYGRMDELIDDYVNMYG